MEFGEKVLKECEDNNFSSQILIIYLISKVFDSNENKEELNKFVKQLLDMKIFKEKIGESEEEQFDPLELQFLALSSSNSFINALISKLTKEKMGSFHSFEAVNQYMKETISNVLKFKAENKHVKVDLSVLGIQYLFALILNGDQMKKLKEIEIILNMDARFFNLF